MIAAALWEFYFLDKSAIGQLIVSAAVDLWIELAVIRYWKLSPKHLQRGRRLIIVQCSIYMTSHSQYPPCICLWFLVPSRPSHLHRSPLVPHLLGPSCISTLSLNSSLPDNLCAHQYQYWLLLIVPGMLLEVAGRTSAPFVAETPLRAALESVFSPANGSKNRAQAVVDFWAALFPARSKQVFASFCSWFLWFACLFNHVIHYIQASHLIWMSLQSTCTAKCTYR